MFCYIHYLKTEKGNFNMSALSHATEDPGKFIAIYNGPGTTVPCIQSTKKLLTKFLPEGRFRPFVTDLGTIFKNHVESNTILVIPGGNGLEQLYSIELSPSPSYEYFNYYNNLFQFLNNGGAIHATCAGGITLSHGLYLDQPQPGKPRFSERSLCRAETPLGLLNSCAFSPLKYNNKDKPTSNDIVYSDVRLSDHASFPESLRGKTVRFLDASSIGWHPDHTHSNDTILGVYTDCIDINTAAILSKTIGKGKVWAQGAHLEFTLDEIPDVYLTETARKEPKLTPDEQSLRLELFYHSFRTLGLRI
jgi:glutamine amidotransferase-like uncharacterized protein